MPKCQTIKIRKSRSLLFVLIRALQQPGQTLFSNQNRAFFGQGLEPAQHSCGWSVLEPLTIYLVTTTNDWTYNSKMCLKMTIFTNTTRRARQAVLERVQLELRVGHTYTKNWQDQAVGGAVKTQENSVSQNHFDRGC